MGKNVAVFVDVANIFYAAKAAGVDIDYVTLLKSATAGRDFVRAYAYTGLDPENENQRNFHSFLARHGYKVVSKDIRKYGDGKVKANLDIELVVDMMKTARNLDVAVVISGDGDFAPAIRAVQEMGVRVEVISFRGNTSSDLIEVADLFTDITQIAKVEKGSVRSGRRVAGDDEDLSMTEVPDKQTEGTGRGRGRGRGRAAAAESAAPRPSTRGRARPAAAAEAPAATAGVPLVVLPGERLSKAAQARIAAEATNGTAEPAPAEELREDLGTGVAAEEEPTEEGRRRRRRRRGGRGRGRGRGADVSTLEGAVESGGIETLYLEDLEEAEEAEEAEDLEEAEPVVPVAPRRAPRAATFGSVWDTQIGMPSAPTGELEVAREDEDFEEPEIPEYLIAEQRRDTGGRSGGSGGRGGRSGGSGGRGGRSAYVAAMERERYGGRGGGGLNRYPDVSGRASARPEPPRRQEHAAGRPAAAGRPPAGGRPAGGGRHAGGGRPSGGEPWSEVPPELEEMLRAQLAAKSGRDATAAPAGGEPAPSAEAEKPRRRTTRKPAATAAPAGGEPAPSAEAEKPRRRTTRKPAATAAPAGGEPAPSAEAEKPKRRTTRKPAATAALAGGEPAPSAEAEKPKRRTTRKPAATGG